MNKELADILKEIHDEADHIIGTKAGIYEECYKVACVDAKEIKKLAKKALKLLEKG